MRKGLAAVTAVLLLLSGCVPGVDITKRAIVTAAEVTLQQDGYLVTVEALSKLGREEQSYEDHTGEGKTFAQAVTDLELKTGKSLYLDGCKVLIVNGFSNAGELKELLGEIDSHGGIRPLTLVAAGTGEKNLLAQTGQGKESMGEELFSLLSGVSAKSLPHGTGHQCPLNKLYHFPNRITSAGSPPAGYIHSSSFPRSYETPGTGTDGRRRCPGTACPWPGNLPSV